MNRIINVSLILILTQGIFISASSAVEIKSRNEYLVDTRGDDGDIARSGFSVHKTFETYQVEVSLFGEAQWNLDASEWEKLIAGIETGRLFWGHVYVGQSVQFITGEILDYVLFSVNSNSVDTTTKVNFLFPIWKALSFRAFEEYSLNIEEGRDEFNEIGSEVIYTIKDTSTIGVGWRHTDRIHNFDSDYLTFFLSLSF